MSNEEPPRQFVVGDRRPPRDHGLILDGIGLMQEELGMVSAEVPRTYAGAKYLYEELIAKVEPPTPGQVARINRLVSEVGGIVSGKLQTRRQAVRMIRELRKVRKRMRANASPKAYWAGLVAVTAAGVAGCLLLWPEVTAGWLLLIGGLVFVVGGAFYVLGLWDKTFSIILGGRPPGN